PHARTHPIRGRSGHFMAASACPPSSHVQPDRATRRNESDPACGTDAVGGQPVAQAKRSGSSWVDISLVLAEGAARETGPMRSAGREAQIAGPMRSDRTQGPDQQEEAT